MEGIYPKLVNWVNSVLKFEFKNRSGIFFGKSVLKKKFRFSFIKSVTISSQLYSRFLILTD